MYAAHLANTPRPLRMDFQGAASVLRARDTGEPVIVYRNSTALALDYLAQPPLLMTIAKTVPELEAAIATASKGLEPFWLVILADAYRAHSDIESRVRAHGRDFRSYDFPGCQPVRLYRVAGRSEAKAESASMIGTGTGRS